MNQQRSWPLLAIGLAALMVFYVNIGPTPGGDFWLQAKIGDLIVANRAIPETMLFPFTEMSTEPFNAHEWLASVLFHVFLSVFHEKNLPLVLGFLGLAFFAGVCALVHERGVRKTSFVLLLGLLALLSERERHTMRPELVSLVLMVVYWYFLEKFRVSARALYGLTTVLLCVLWVNCHGSFVVAPLLATVYAAGIYLDQVRKSSWRNWHPGREVQQFGVLTLALLFACLINPFGMRLLSFVLDFGLHNDFGELVGEWTPTWDRRLWHYQGFWVFVVLWVATLGSLFLYRRKISAVEVLVFLGFTVLELRAIRFTVYSGLVLSYVLAARVAEVDLHPESDVRFCRLLSAISPLIMAYSLAFGGGLGSPRYAAHIPTKLTDAMVGVLADPRRQGNVLNMNIYGSELIYRTWPRLRPSVDDRIDTYGLEYLKFQIALLSNDALLDEFVTRYDVRYILISSPVFFSTFQRTANWKGGRWASVWVDEKAALLIRSDLKY